MAAFVAARRIGRAVGRRRDRNAAVVLAVLVRGAHHGFGEAIGDRTRDVEHRFLGTDADRADFVLAPMAAAAEQGPDPARVGVLVAADVQAEPDAGLEPVPEVAAPFRPPDTLPTLRR